MLVPIFSFGNTGQAAVMSAAQPAIAVQPGLVRVKPPVLAPPLPPLLAPAAALPALPLAPPELLPPTLPPALPPLLVPPAGEPACELVPPAPAWLAVPPVALPPVATEPATFAEPALPPLALGWPPLAAPATFESASLDELQAMVRAKQENKIGHTQRATG